MIIDKTMEYLYDVSECLLCAKLLLNLDVICNSNILLTFSGNQNVPDLETILKTIRSAWNTPKSRTVFNRYV